MRPVMIALPWAGVLLAGFSTVSFLAQALLRDFFVPADTAASMGILGVSLILLPQFANAYFKTLVNLRR